MFLLAASRFGLPPDKCIVVEDAVAGLEGARRAGMRCIGVSRSRLHLPADIILTSLDLLEPDSFDKLVHSNPQS